MRVLMFGWEFPPHITGGLGTACYGLTKGLSSLEDIDLLFVVPKAYGDEDQNVAKLIGASDVKVRKKRFYHSETLKEHINRETLNTKEIIKEQVEKDIWKDITYIEVGSVLIPYLTPQEYEEIMQISEYDHTKIMENVHEIWLKKDIEKKITERTQKTFETKEEWGTFEFSGKYGKNLLQEVSNYAKVATSIANEHQFDVIHSHDWLTYAAGIAAKRISGKPLVIHVHATEFDRSGENVNQMVYDIERMGMKNADKIITVSNLTRNTVINKYGISPEKVTTVYNAVEPIKANESKKLVVKKSIDEKIVTFLGRVTFQKGPEYFIEAAYKVLQREDNVRFVMAGSGDMLRKMIRRAAQLRIMDKFHFTDFLKGDDVDRMFGMSDVYVMPSVSEPFGISPLEAMRSNVPVIISKQSGVAEILRHALKVDFWDIDAIADAIHGLLKFDSLSKMFRRYGKEEVDSLKWENAAVHVKQVYAEAINKS